MIPYSPTSLQTYKKCPKLYRAQYIEKQEQKSTPAMERGALIHRWIDEYVSSDFVPPSYSVEDFDEGKRKRVMDFLNPLVFLLHAYVSTEIKVGIDRNERLVDFDSPACFLRGVIDFLVVNEEKTRGILIDWKTGKSTADDFQIEVYSYLLSCLLPLIPFSFYHFYVDRKRGECLKEVKRREINKVQEEIYILDEKISNEKEWACTPSYACFFCDLEDCEKKFSLNRKENKLKELALKGFNI